MSAPTPSTPSSSAPASSAPGSSARAGVGASHLLLLLAVSVGWEWLFLHAGINKLDEGWTLYAAKRLHEGAVLYRDVLFVFPPGHLLSAWIGYALDPPGIVVARIIYAAFNVALCIALYFLGRRLLPASFALASFFLARLYPITEEVLERIDDIFGRPGERSKSTLLPRAKVRASEKDVLAWRRSLALDDQELCFPSACWIDASGTKSGLSRLLVSGGMTRD